MKLKKRLKIEIYNVLDRYPEIEFIYVEQKNKTVEFTIKTYANGEYCIQDALDEINENSYIRRQTKNIYDMIGPAKIYAYSQNKRLSEDRNINEYYRYSMNSWIDLFSNFNDCEYGKMLNLVRKKYGHDIAMRAHVLLKRRIMYGRLDYADNYRIAVVNDEEAMKLFNESKKKGCCGIYEAVRTINRHYIIVGCNYGH